MGLFDRLRGKLSAGSKPTLESFCKELIAAIRAAGSPDTFRFDPEEQAIIRYRGGEAVGRMGPANMYQSWAAAAPADRPKMMSTFVRAAVSTERQLPEDYDAAKVDLRPRLWGRAAIEFHRLQGMGPSLTTIPVGNHILASVVYDWPESVQSIPPDQFDKWDVTAYQALEDAVANLSEATEGYAAIGENLCTFITGDSYDASRILLSNWIERMELKGRKIAMAPNRDALMVTGEDDEDGIRMMTELAAEALEAPYPLSPVPMVWEDGAWIDWLPPEGHPMRGKLRQMRTQFLGPMYDRQRELLEARHEKEGVDLFVASVMAVKKDGDEIVTYSVWGQNVETLLPETDHLALMSEGAGMVALGPFDKVKAVVGELLEETEKYPPRWRTRGFPTQEQIERIGMGKLS